MIIPSFYLICYVITSLTNFSKLLYFSQNTLMNFLHMISENLLSDKSLTTIPTWNGICSVGSVLLELQLNMMILTGVVLESLQGHSASLNSELFRDGDSTVHSPADIFLTRLLPESEYSGSLSTPRVLKDRDFKILDNSLCGGRKWTVEIGPASKKSSSWI